jgi:hypothetical protein
MAEAREPEIGVAQDKPNLPLSKSGQKPRVCPLKSRAKHTLHVKAACSSISASAVAGDLFHVCSRFMNSVVSPLL